MTSFRNAMLESLAADLLGAALAWELSGPLLLKV